ncbi:hypothetical protein Aconfl_18760 [Algoriphagus confluentis]|uniref:Uncharacterized protein n=1 Tax=Algoriphagus confluentis TaxID=1697556 RepID=A0ABQ6PMN5_9BACT|nr:hypothetical protein Aconfl_18760 [Algoriphagus confluentis]
MLGFFHLKLPRFKLKFLTFDYLKESFLSHSPDLLIKKVKSKNP